MTREKRQEILADIDRMNGFRFWKLVVRMFGVVAVFGGFLAVVAVYFSA